MKWRALLLMICLLWGCSPVNAATIGWTPPTQNTDGTPLTDLDHYNLYIGTATGAYDFTVTIPGTAITYVIDHFATATTYYVALTAVNVSGRESIPSNEISFVLSVPEEPLNLVILP